MSRMFLGIVAVGSLAALTFGLSPAKAAPGGKLDISLCSPSSNTFTLNFSNQYFPLPPNGVSVLVGPDEGEIHAFQITVLGTKDITVNGRTVRTRVVEEREWKDGGDGTFDDGADTLIEVSLNYFAQVRRGAQPETVCYFGEDVVIYVDGQPTGPSPDTGSWLAGAPQLNDPNEVNLPGIFMPANPKPGMHFMQEFAPDLAEDEASIVGVGPVTIGDTTYTNTIRVREFNPLDGDKGYKVYARNVGLIADGDLLLQAD